MSTAPRIGLALGGGGAKGICHIAFLQVLEDLGLRPSVIAGTSIGSIFGGLYAAGLSAPQLAEILPQLKPWDVYRMIDVAAGADSALLKGHGVRQVLDRLLPVKRFEELRVPCKIVTTDYWQRSPVIFERTGDVVTAMRASMAIPGVFAPVVYDGRVLVDGGVVDPLPFGLVRDECDLLIAVDVSGEKSHDSSSQVPPAMETVFGTFQIMGASIVQANLRRSKVDVYLKPRLLDVRVLEFHRHQEIMDSVTDDAEQLRRELEQWLEHWDGAVDE